MYGQHALQTGLHEEVNAQHVANASRHMQGSAIPLWLTATTLCWLNGTIPAMLPWAFSLIRLHQEATRKFSGCVSDAQRGGSTATQQCQCIEPQSIPQAVPFALARKLASATRCRHTTLSWQQNGILPGMQAHLMITQHILPAWLGGRLTNAQVGSRAFLIVQSLLMNKINGCSSNNRHCSSLGQHMLLQLQYFVCMHELLLIHSPYGLTSNLNTYLALHQGPMLASTKATTLDSLCRTTHSLPFILSALLEIASARTFSQGSRSMAGCELDVTAVQMPISAGGIPVYSPCTWLEAGAASSHDKIESHRAAAAMLDYTEHQHCGTYSQHYGHDDTRLTYLTWLFL